jgi:TRAP-type transport system periplasmic protein
MAGIHIAGRFAALFSISLALLAPAPAGAAMALKFSDTTPPHSSIAVFFEKWAAEISKADPSVLTMKAYHSTLGNVRTNYDTVVNGVADAAWFNPEYYPGKFSRVIVSTLPYMSERAEVGSVALWRMYEKHFFDADFNEVRLIGIHAYPGTVIHAAFPVHRIEDLKGHKIAIQSRHVADAIELLGATPVSLPLPSVYQAARQRLVEGIGVGWAAVEHFKLYEVTAYHLETNLGGANAVVAVGNKTWAKWPDAVKKVVMSRSGEGLSRRLGAFWDHETRHNQEVVSKMAGHHDVVLPAAETARLQKMIEPASKGWMRSTPGAEKLVAEFKAEYARAAAEAK